ncbi:K02A2.6-like [Cordylochernes scorpioides]|uniref:RNA-directed DNA polymerase n=1 Tax=Cordylochernes scorpioides TaxID=51811 RepID=A0ABY6L680_9ARAC|nr:K02A2.6-like [Cordylochernes scorpioides]
MNSYCNKCKRRGHYAKVCRSVAIYEVKSEITFLGSVEIESSKKWVVPIKVNNRRIKFKIDTEADVNVLPFQQYCQSFQRIKLEKSDKILQGPNGIPLKTVGMIHVILQDKGQHLNSKIYIVDKLKQPLLSRETSEKLNIVRMIQQLSPKHEALMPSEFPIRPWQKVGMDLFYLNGRWYLIVCDYYSRYPEISLLQNLTAQEVISRLKSIFARHGMPETVRSDNGPQFQKVLGSKFSRFSKEWSFKHITSSPRFPQSNGFIEAIIKNIKQSLKKEENCYLTLQAYRTMPLENGLPQLQQGDSVWIRDQKVEGKVLHKSQEPRSYWVQTPQGKVGRNRLHLTRLPTTESTMDAPEDSRRQELRNEEAPLRYQPGKQGNARTTRTRRPRRIARHQKAHLQEKEGRGVKTKTRIKRGMRSPPPFDINQASKEMQGRPWLLVVPKSLRLEVLRSFHDAPTAGHLGFAKTYVRIRRRFFWPGLFRSVRNYVGHCRECQRRKSTPQLPPGNLKPIIPSSIPFQKIGIDLLGRFPLSRDDNRWVIVCTDYLTKYAITKALPTGRVVEISKFILNDINLKHGAPREMITDRGHSFHSKLVNELAKMYEMSQLFTTAYHPQTNGLTERLNKTLGDMLSIR